MCVCVEGRASLSRRGSQNSQQSLSSPRQCFPSSTILTLLSCQGSILVGCHSFRWGASVHKGWGLNTSTAKGGPDPPPRAPGPQNTKFSFSQRFVPKSFGIFIKFLLKKCPKSHLQPILEELQSFWPLCGQMGVSPLPLNQRGQVRNPPSLPSYWTGLDGDVNFEMKLKWGKLRASTSICRASFIATASFVAFSWSSGREHKHIFCVCLGFSISAKFAGRLAFFVYCLAFVQFLLIVF